MRLHSLELLPDAAGDAHVRREWQALGDAGLPSQADHAGATNAPHVTVVEVPALTADDEARAVDLLSPLLPIAARLTGLVVLGGRRATLARLVEVDDTVVRTVLRLRGEVPGHPRPGWLPHVTVAPRLPRDLLPRALDVLGYDEAELSLTALRRWDPEAERVRRL